MPSDPAKRPSGAPELPEALRGPGPEVRGPVTDAKRRRAARAVGRPGGVDPSSWQKLTRLAVIGSNFGLMVLGGALLGLGIDWLAGTRPVFLLIFAGAGLFSGGWAFIRQARAWTGGELRDR